MITLKWPTYGVIFSVQKIFENVSQGIYNESMCIIEPEHSNWMKPYIMVSISLRKDANNESEKDFFKLMNNRVFGKTMKNIRRMSWSRNFKMVILKNVPRFVHKIWPLPGPRDMNKYASLWRCSALDERGPKVSQDTRDMWRSSMARTTLFSVCTRPF